VTAGSLLPPLVGLYGLPQAAVWRASSVIIAIPIFAFVATLPRRRWAASHHKAPWYVWTLLSLQLLTALCLLMNAMGQFGDPGIAPYATAMSVFLFTAGSAYLLALAAALREPPTWHTAERSSRTQRCACGAATGTFVVRRAAVTRSGSRRGRFGIPWNRSPGTAFSVRSVRAMPGDLRALPIFLVVVDRVGDHHAAMASR